MFVLFMVKYYKVGRQGIGDILRAGVTAITLLGTSMGYTIYDDWELYNVFNIMLHNHSNICTWPVSHWYTMSNILGKDPEGHGRTK